MTWPTTAYRFFVTLNSGDAYLDGKTAAMLPRVAAAGFQSATGLSGELQLMSYAEGGRNGSELQLPVRHKWGRITLKVGIVRDPSLWRWYEAGLVGTLGARRDGSIILADPDGTHRMSWTFFGGLAARWTGPSLDAGVSAIAVESLEIAHHGLHFAGASGGAGTGAG